MSRSSPRSQFQVCILAGGLSTRMGREKSRLKLGGATILARVRTVANESLSDLSSSRVQVIRKDRVSRCGPLGGIFTGLCTSEARAILFLACDMPLVSATLLKKVVRASRNGGRSVFVSQCGRLGFPCLLPRTAALVVEKQIAGGEFSLHALAKKLGANELKVSPHSRELMNVNTPDDLQEAQRVLSDSR